jgi:hypothetical protein
VPRIFPGVKKEISIWDEVNSVVVVVGTTFVVVVTAAVVAVGGVVGGIGVTPVNPLIAAISGRE